jgi:hypothetical protein
LGSKSNERARLCEDTIQTFIDDPDVGFMHETTLALHEAHFRYGVVEVGYTADWIDNPNAGKPMLKESTSEAMKDSEGNDVMEPDRHIQNELMFVRRIPAIQFRVSSSLKNLLHQNDWVGYWEWHYVEDIKRNKAYKNTATIKATGKLKDTVSTDEDDYTKDDPEGERAGMVKVWKIWDLRTKKRFVLCEGHKKYLLDGEPFSFLPFAVMKFHEQLDNFYPMPPVHQWVCPQDEFNETRDSQRAHRRRFYRRYWTINGAMDPKEMDKLENGGDGVIAVANMPNPIMPVPDAPMGADAWSHLAEIKQDMLIVSGVSGDQRGVAESETATQATIIDGRAKLRESSSRTRVAEWLAAIARLILLTAREKMALPFWITRNADPAVLEQDPTAAIVIKGLWEEITAESIDGVDLDVTVELASMSPITEEAFRNSWNQVLALLTNPALLQVLALSPALLRRTLMLYGIRQENDIQEVQNVIQQMMMMAQQAAQQEQLNEAKDEAGKAGVVPSLIEQAGAAGPGGPLIPPEVQRMIETGGGVN